MIWSFAAPRAGGARQTCARVRSSTLALALASLLPALFGAGPTYLVGAVVGGAHMLGKAWRLATAPSRQAAIACFLSSLVQLSVVLAAACVDAALR